MRQIVLLILLVIVGQWISRALRNRDARASSGAQRAGSGPGASGGGADARYGAGAGGAYGRNGNANAGAAPQLAEPMIRCVECGVHAPRSESIVVAGQPFCCITHAKRHETRASGQDSR